jgi:AraC-like DNA-binding protein
MHAAYTVSQDHVRLSAARPVRCASPRVAASRVDAHDHDYFELFVVRSGSARHITPDYDLRATRGTVGILSPGEIHSLYDCDGLEVTNVYYLAEWLLAHVSGAADREHLRALFLEPALFAPPEGRVVPQVELNEAELYCVLRDLDDLAREATSELPSQLYLRSALLKSMIVIARAFARATSEALAPLRDETWAVMQECERAVAAGRPADVPGVARRFSVTRDHLGRIFRASTGTTPTAFFARRRVLAAASRLLDPATTVTDVALELGYADTAHLSRQFRRELGLSPREYRALYKVR